MFLLKVYDIILIVNIVESLHIIHIDSAAPAFLIYVAYIDEEEQQAKHRTLGYSGQNGFLLRHITVNSYSLCPVGYKIHNPLSKIVFKTHISYLVN